MVGFFFGICKEEEVKKYYFFSCSSVRSRFFFALRISDRSNKGGVKVLVLVLQPARRATVTGKNSGRLNNTALAGRTWKDRQPFGRLCLEQAKPRCAG